MLNMLWVAASLHNSNPLSARYSDAISSTSSSSPGFVTPFSIWASAKHSIHFSAAVRRAGQAYLSWQYRAARQLTWSILKDEPPARRTELIRQVDMHLGICVHCSLASIYLAAGGDMAHLHARGMV